MIPLEQFLQGIRAIEAAQPTYRLGGCGVDGACDCIGLIIGAIRRAGGKWAGTHGSNYAARHEMAGLRRVTSPGQLEVGEAVYKARAPGEAGYDLPAQYQSSGDLLDYYHVGVVMSVSPLEIWHCTSSGAVSGIKIDTKLGDQAKSNAWAWAGELGSIHYPREGDTTLMIAQARVYTPDQNPAKLRSTPDTTRPYLAKIPHGARVEVLETGSAWCTVLAQGKRGYMMRQFLALEGEELPLEEDAARAGYEGGLAALEARLAALEARMAALEG